MTYIKDSCKEARLKKFKERLGALLVSKLPEYFSYSLTQWDKKEEFYDVFAMEITDLMQVYLKYISDVEDVYRWLKLSDLIFEGESYRLCFNFDAFIQMYRVQVDAYWISSKLMRDSLNFSMD